MRYTLALLTHGRARAELDETVAAFWHRTSVKPHRLVCYVDGPGDLPPVTPDGTAWEVTQGHRQEGFCKATARLWEIAAETDTPFVFWLENDFRLVRPLDPRVLAQILLSDPMLAQAALWRQPVSQEEQQHGSLRETMAARGIETIDCTTRVGDDMQEWVAHRGWFTTNPSLMRTAFMQANPFPTHRRECEGKFGLDLIGRGYRFAYLGDGRRPWVEHFGVRTGRGY